MGRAIGIDLGTTNSCAAIIENGKPRVITHANGQKTIPSVFAIDKQGNRLIGEEAKKQAAANPMNTVAAAKRLIGRSYGSQQIEKMKQVFTYELVEGESSEVLVKVTDQVFTLEQISAAILRRIKDSTEDSLSEEIDQAVITVPAYFNDRQRQAVRAAGKLAGLKVLRVLNEPTAAALAYGLGRALNQRVAIYDLGGGTFDISIIDIKDKIFEVVATGGDTFLGGVDFDDRLMQHIMQDFLDKTGVDLSYDRRAVTMMRDSSEAAKIRLSSVETTRVQIEAIAEDDDKRSLNVDIEVTRDLLEKLTFDLVERSIATCERILEEAKSTREQIDEMLLVGGQSRMPLVRRKVKGFVGREPSQKVHPDEAVAIGAAIMAHSLAKAGAAADMTLLDVLPSAIGINKKDGSMHQLFGKNQPLPDYKTRVLTTSRDNQRSILVKLFQGESKMVAENEHLGTFVFAGLRDAPQGAIKVEVTFHIDSEGILNVTARDQSTGQLVESRLRLGKDDGEKKDTSRPKKKKVKEEEKPPPAPPPMPLVMPSSSLQAKNSPLSLPSTAAGLVPLVPSMRPPDLVKKAPSEAEPVAPTELLRRKPSPPARQGFFARLLNWFFSWFRRK